MTRVAVFIDYQNAYMRARECFAGRTARPRVGQIVPRFVGELLVARGLRVDPKRQLSAVLVARGLPSAEHSPIGNAAAKRQVVAWKSQAGVTVATRPLQYLNLGVDGSGIPILQPREKGVDVLVALALVLGAERDDFDVAVLFSEDTDLVPAVDAVRAIGKRCEVAAWRPARGFGKALRVPGVWRHWLTEADYDQLHDPTDYTKSSGGP